MKNIVLKIPSPPEENKEILKFCLGSAYTQNENLKGLTLEEMKEIGWNKYESSFHDAFKMWKLISEMNHDQLQGLHSVGTRAIAELQKDLEATQSVIVKKQDFLKKNYLNDFLKKQKMHESKFLSLQVLLFTTFIVQAIISKLETETIKDAQNHFSPFVEEIRGLLFSLKLRDLSEEFLEKSNFDDYLKLDSILENYDWDNSHELKIFNSILFLIFKLILNSEFES